MPVIDFPPEFDSDYYRKSYPELNYFPDNILLEHYKRFAVEQGRSTCIYDRHDYLQSILQNIVDERHLEVLEISPWDHPFLRGENVKYFATTDAESLRRNSIEAKRPFNDVPEKIDFISPNGDLSIVDETFDIVVSVHVIEHCPDIIKHFQSVSRILNAGGLYILVVHDKRYCFDYYHAESTITEVIDAYIAERKFPRLSNVLNFTATHNDAILHWLGNHGDRYGYGVKEVNRGEVFQRMEKFLDALNAGEYMDAHNWRFTPDSFGYIVDILNKLEFIDLRLYRLCHTIWGRFEFVTMLEKT